MNPLKYIPVLCFAFCIALLFGCRRTIPCKCQNDSIVPSTNITSNEEETYRPSTDAVFDEEKSVYVLTSVTTGQKNPNDTFGYIAFGILLPGASPIDHNMNPRLGPRFITVTFQGPISYSWAYEDDSILLSPLPLNPWVKCDSNGMSFAVGVTGLGPIF